MKKRIGIIIVAICLIMLTIGTSLAWYRPLMADFGDANVAGKIKNNYFERGIGTEENPYVIARPVQLYNFAWLQYLGYLNENSEGGQVYVQLLDDITTEFKNNDGSAMGAKLDMSGYVLPPIGTASHPYGGQFDGRGNTIDNLTVSNDANPSEGLKDIPDAAYQAEQRKLSDSAEIIGFFGVIGDYNGKASSFAPSVHNFFLEDITVSSQTDKCLIGLVGGYVNGEVEGVGVIGSKIKIKNGTGVLDSTNLTNGYSDTSLFGYVDTAFRNINKEVVVFGDVSSKPSGGQETDTGRGTIKMIDIYKRLSYMYGAKYKDFHSLNAYNIFLYGGGPGATYNLKDNPISYHEDYYSKSGSTYKYAAYFLNSPSYLPISIDNSTLQMTEEKAKDYNSGITKDYVVTNQYYREHATEAILPHNTGYITGSGSMESVAGTRIAFKPAEWINAFSTGKKEMFGYINGSWQEITEQNSSGITRYQNYWDTALPTLFGDGETAGSLFWQAGDHYYTPSLSFERSGTNTTPTIFSASGAQIDGVGVSKLIANGVEFKLDEDGVLTVAMAANYSTGNGQNGAELYYVSDYDGANPSAVRIDKVYTDSAEKAYYVTQNQTDTYAGNTSYTLKYNREWMWSWAGGKVYYFEIPISVEEHSIYYITNSKGAASNESFFASFVYLDIAAGKGAGLDVGDALGALSMKETVYTHKVNDGANFVSSGATSIGTDAPCVEYKITVADQYNYSRSSNTLTITSDSEGTPAYIAPGMTVTTSTNNYTDADSKVTDSKFWVEGESKNWTIIYMKDGTSYKLYLNNEEIESENLAQYQYIKDKFDAYLEENPFDS